MLEPIRRGVPPHFFIDEQWLGALSEDVIEPELPIIDAHHHLWSRAAPYLVPELVGDLACGHNLRGTVYVEAGFASALPEVPTFAEAGVAPVQADFVFALLAPAGTPPAVAEKIASAIRKIMAEPEFRDKNLDPFGYVMVASSPAELGRYIAQDRATQDERVKVAGVKME